MITIYKDKITYSQNTGLKKKDKLKIVDPKLLFTYLGDSVQLEKNLPFSRIMELLYINRNLTDMVFSHVLGHYNFELFYNDFNAELSAEDKKAYKMTKGEALEVYHYPDCWRFKKDAPCEVSYAWDIHIVKPKEDINYSIMLAKLAGLKKHPIRINTNYKIVVQDTTVKITPKNIKTRYKPILVGQLTNIKLFDFIWAILYEISWSGSPKDRDQLSEDLGKKSKAIEDGTVKLVPLKLGKTKKKKSTLRG